MSDLKTDPTTKKMTNPPHPISYLKLNYPLLQKRILLLNGPNLNLLGTREPHIYGYETLKDVEQKAISQASSLGHELLCYQTNHEGNIIDRIHQARDEKIDAIIVSQLRLYLTR